MEHIAQPSRIGQIQDPKEAFWQIARFLSQHPAYRNTPFANIQRLQQSIALGQYYCLSDGNSLQAVATWQEVNAERLLRDFPRYVAEAGETTDAIFITSLVGTDSASLRRMAAILREMFADKDVYWNRHKGKLGHRAKKPAARKSERLN